MDVVDGIAGLAQVRRCIADLGQLGRIRVGQVDQGRPAA
jgi:hypothetical protein